MDIADHCYEKFESLYSLNQIAGFIPGWLHLNRLDTLELLYMCPRMQADLKVTIEEVRKKGVRFLEDITHPNTNNGIIALLKETTGNFPNIKEAKGAFYQYLLLPDRGYEWFLSSSRYFAENIAITISIPVSDILDFDIQLKQLLTDNILLRYTLNPGVNLTAREKEILRLFVQGKTQNEIAAAIIISPFTVKTHIQNIRRKLGVNNQRELVKFVQVFGL